MGGFAGISGKFENGKVIMWCTKCKYIFDTEDDKLIGTHLMLCSMNDRKIINKEADR